MRITHVVATDQFAGTERYVAEVSRRQAERGHDVVVLGGPGERMAREVAPATWCAAPSFPTAFRALVGRSVPDVVHAHLSAAEGASLLALSWRGCPVVSTRHIAQRRGSSWPVRAASKWINQTLRLQLAISEHVAQAIETAPDAVLHNGVAPAPDRIALHRRTILVLQRLSPEKDTGTALRAWAASGLGEEGWQLHIAGAGAEEPALRLLAEELRAPGVVWLGLVDDVAPRLDSATVLLAPAPSEPLGLSVLEAMARGVPVVAARGGGHLESLGAEHPWLFTPRDVDGAAACLRAAVSSPERLAEVSRILQERQRRLFDIEAHVDVLLGRYEALLNTPDWRATRRGPRR